MESEVCIMKKSKLRLGAAALALAALLTACVQAVSPKTSRTAKHIIMVRFI